MTSIPVYEFSAFRLVPARRLLSCDGRPMKLGSRAFDLLLALVERHERVVTKQELLDLVWPNEDVGEANLAVQVMSLRKVLGRAAIVSMPGRGYRFTLPVQATCEADSPASAPGWPLPRHNLPVRHDGLVGRGAEVRALEALLERHWLVCVTGPGGVGKTRLAQHVAARTCNDDTLAVGLAAGTSHVFLAASLNAEYLQRVLPLRERVHAGLPPPTAGLFWARLVRASSRTPTSRPRLCSGNARVSVSPGGRAETPRTAPARCSPLR